MRGTSFNPSAEFLTIAANVANLAPEENETTEIGFKTDVLNRRLSLTAAVFRTDKTNARVPDPANLTVMILAGLTRVEGIELGAIGRVTDQWQVFAGYTHLRSEIVSHTTPAMVGKELSTLRTTPSRCGPPMTSPRSGRSAAAPSTWMRSGATPTTPRGCRHIGGFDAMTSYKLTTQLAAAAQPLQPDQRVLLRPGLQQLGGAGSRTVRCADTARPVVGFERHCLVPAATLPPGGGGLMIFGRDEDYAP